MGPHCSFCGTFNGPFLYREKATPDEYKAGLDLAIKRGWLVLHESSLVVAPGLMCREPQLRCALFAFRFDDFALAFFERFQFLLCRLKKTVACKLQNNEMRPCEFSSTPDGRRKGDDGVASMREHHAMRRSSYRIATGLIILCTPPLKRGWPRTNRNS